MTATEKNASARRQEKRERDLFWEYRLWPHARLMELTRGAKSLQCRVAGRILANRGSAAAFRDAVKLCRAPEPALRVRGAWLLGQLRLPDTDKGRILSFDLARAAGQIGDPALIPVLEKALKRFGDETDHGSDKGIIATALERLREKK